MDQDDEQRQIAHLHSELLQEYEGVLAADELTARLEAVVASFAQAPVRTFVPVLARRRVRAELARR